MKSSLGHIGHVVKSFLDQHWDKKSPLLVGYSGGPDSKALLYAAIDWGKAPVHIAHVDHGWRIESGNEALVLQNEAERLGATFHTIRLEKMTTENEARQCRLAFFRSLQERFSFQAILLGHHADDLAETVLKRLFEGANLFRLGSMRFTSTIDGVSIWRPMLSISKNEINRWLVERSLDAIDDASNRDLHYLRARMRSEILPFLNKSFGKNISENLAILSERACELEDYLSFRSGQFMKKPVKGPFGWWVDGRGLHRLELRYLLQQVVEQEGVVFARPLLESTLGSMLREKANHKVSIQQRDMIVDRGHFFLLSQQMPVFRQPIFPFAGRQRSGDWVVEEVGFIPTAAQCNWQSLWKGEALFQCFDGSPALKLPVSGIRWPEKVPFFLRKICPVLLENERLIADFVTGRARIGQRCIKIFVDIL